MKWISSSVLPSHKGDVLVYVEDWDKITIGCYDGRHWKAENTIVYVNVWMELPYPPTEINAVWN